MAAMLDGWRRAATRLARWAGGGSGANQAAAPDFTVVITTCNRPHMLPRALASALRQTYDNFDIVVADDASDPPAVIGNTGRRKVTLVRSSNRLGFAGAINFGASHASGRWIAFLDDDDEYEPDLLRAIRARFEAMPQRQFCWASTIFTLYDELNRRGGETIRRFSADYETDEELILAAVSVGSGYGFTVERKIFHELGGFDAQNYWAIADTEFFYRLIAAGYRPTVVAEPLMRVHKHVGPRMTDAGSFRNRLRQCELLRTRYADLLGRHPRLAQAVQTSIERLTALALAAESPHGVA